MSLTPINDIMSRSTAGELVPKVGMGVTYLMWSDRHPGTIVAVVYGGRGVSVQRDKCTVKPGKTYINTESQGDVWDIEPTVIEDGWDGRVQISNADRFTKRKNGCWVKEGSPMRSGQRIAIGYRERYEDPHF